jgi:hypothetical protein
LFGNACFGKLPRTQGAFIFGTTGGDAFVEGFSRHLGTAALAGHVAVTTTLVLKAGAKRVVRRDTTFLLCSAVGNACFIDASRLYRATDAAGELIHTGRRDARFGSVERIAEASTLVAACGDAIGEDNLRLCPACCHAIAGGCCRLSKFRLDRCDCPFGLVDRTPVARVRILRPHRHQNRCCECNSSRS